MKERLLPFYNERDTEIDMLVLHSTIFDIEKFLYYSNQYENSAHYYIDTNGEITKLVDEKNRAWHAGKGTWKGSDKSSNSRSIGIEIRNLTLGQTPYDDVQVKELIKLCKKIIKKYNIKSENIVAHSDISPEGKPDPGHLFPWRTLSEHGIGLWYDIKNANKIKSNNIEELLSIIGYSTNNIEASSYAFCRRWLPEFIVSDFDIQHLVDNVLPDNFDFMKEEKFLRTLKAVAYEYNKKP